MRGFGEAKQLLFFILVCNVFVYEQQREYFSNAKTTLNTKHNTRDVLVNKMATVKHPAQGSQPKCPTRCGKTLTEQRHVKLLQHGHTPAAVM